MTSEKILKKMFLMSALAISLLVAGALAFAVDTIPIMGEKCKDCHADLTRAFTTNVHSKAAAYGLSGASCNSCHRATEQHINTGDKTAVINPARLEEERASATCLECHSSGKGQMYWHGSTHEHLTCVGCHKMHGGNDRLLAKNNESDLCFTCHAEVRADLYKRSRHPMRDPSSPWTEAKMTCSSCHNAHGAKGEKLINAKSFNDKCYECHFEKKAPLLWEHSPVKEDCLTCHNAHGSSNDKMLVTKTPRLCQQCHMQGRHQTGALTANSTFVFNRSCLNCHPQVHGSNNPSGAVLQR